MNKHLNKAKRALAILSLAVLPILPVVPAHAATTATLSLSPASQSVQKGSSITLSIVLNSGGNAAYLWKANLTYSTSYFSSASVTSASGSPFNKDPSQNGDVASGGVISISRFIQSSSGSTYSGTVATVTLQSNGTAGSTSVQFEHVCTSSTDNTPCSSVLTSDGTTGTNVLLSTAGGSYTFTTTTPATAPASASSGSPSTTTTKAKAKTSSTAAAITTPVDATAAPVTTTAKNDTKAVKVMLTITVVDQNGKPVSGAKVTVDGVSGTTDKNGQVTLQNLQPGKTTGSISYGGKTTDINVNVADGSKQPQQTAKFTVQIKKTSAVKPVAISLMVILVIAGGAYAVLRSRNRTIDSSKVVTPMASGIVVSPTEDYKGKSNNTDETTDQ